MEIMYDLVCDYVKDESLVFLDLDLMHWYISRSGLNVGSVIV